MNISVCILAHNEEHNISRTLESLLAQSVFADAWLDGASLQIVVVPNGCSDRTAAIAEQFLRESTARLRNVSYLVAELQEPGKSNAWNHTVHGIAAADADVLVFLDADIEFADPQTIQNCLSRLRDDAHPVVVVDLPLKSFLRKNNLGIREQLSARISQVSAAGDPAISGQFYCIRGEFARQVWMPRGLSVEDGFLYAMVATDCFRAAPDTSRVVRAQGASHYFEGLVGLRPLLRHEIRIMVGTMLNCYLCWDFLLFVTSPSGPGAGSLIRQLNEEKPDWYRDMMRNQIRGHGIFPVPLSFAFGRLKRRASQSRADYLVSLPVRVVAALLDVYVVFGASRKLRSKEAVGFW